VPKRSAGILPFRDGTGRLEVLLVHPGGPFWAAKDDGAWSIPKGEIDEGEDALAAAARELEEETGLAIQGELIPLGSLRQPGGKTVVAWAMRADLDPSSLKSGTFVLEWPRGSGRRAEFPEIDRAAWWPLPEAERKILRGQVPFLHTLARIVETPGNSLGT